MLTLGLTIILGLILLYMGFYLFTHRTKTLFGVFSPKDDPAFHCPARKARHPKEALASPSPAS